MDIKISDDGYLYFTDKDLELATGSDAAAQDIRSRIRFIKGEYFLDTEAGVDYMGVVFQKNSDYNIVNNEFKDAILESPHVEAIIDYSLTIEKSTREATLECSVLCTEGYTIDITEVI